ncbi:copper amine oxidase N-terminal domain-containing protein [Paenibacillus oenotherae]|uniref:Copper amine oxidase N-terminal domain-containing protein n=1 Tax=Paenibacillus oenotherae TaxID=1435645 RepID=A0ABS7D146_9BACL|nr:stalk domain-containing protein [Paenibacillus oenotherae]MBW7473581.1 copper amine oxidase N-terminal domain-containing protein [Paenibacillus oenotherae]
MKSLKWFLILSLLFIPIAGLSVERATAQGQMSDKLVVKMKSNVITHNGAAYKSPQPITVVKGTTFIPFKSIAERYGYTISYDAAKKESIAKSSKGEIRFKIGNKTLWKDGVSATALVAPYVQGGSLMVPLRAWSQITESNLLLSGNIITLTWNAQVLPTANFEVQPAEIYAGETYVNYIDRSTNSTGYPFVEDVWEGKMEIFPEPGTYTVSRQVRDSNGLWSEPYSVTIVVKAPNQPPVADFSTEKSQYRIGEQVTFNEFSYDDENAIVTRKWSGDWTGKEGENVFFDAGEKTVTLEVTDRHGLSHSVSKTFTVTTEVLYTRDEYAKLFTRIGDKFAIDGASVLNATALPYTIQSDTAQMVRSNSPETLIEEGIAYQDQITGQVRFMFHHLNKIGYPVKIYLVATNLNSTAVNVNTSSIGVGGPDPYVVNAGKFSTARYLESLIANESPKWTKIGPKQSVVILPEISKVPLKQDQVFSAYADIYSDQELQYSVVIVAEKKLPLVELPNLKVMPRDDKHTRGTFNGANRVIEITETLGLEPQRIMLGDRKIDTFQDGIDYTNGELQLNFGNYGVLYTLKLPHVAPNTLIALNGRGGEYTGAFIVNGQVVKATTNSILKNNNEAGVLYRTGDKEESLEIVFTPAAGGNMPVAMMFLPLPEERW